MAKCARLSVRIQGDGPAIVFIMGRNAAGKVWDAHQVPSFMANGHLFTMLFKMTAVRTKQ